jgi:ceramide glucosyltransferase
MIGTALLALTLAALGYTAVAILAVRAFARAAPAPPAFPEPVTLLKPLHGVEPGLAANLASFLDQDWAAPIQLVAGANNADDPALAVARALPGDVSIRTDAPPIGANAKVSNLANMATAARHDLLVISDSDMRVGPDYVSRVAAALARPGAGAVTCLYHGVGQAGSWSRLVAAGIDWSFLPSVATAWWLGEGDPCMGSTIALRRETLAAIGGFPAFADMLADDHAIGAAVRGLELSVDLIPGVTLAHGCAEPSLQALVRHELRWAATLRAVSPAGFAGLILTHPLPLALLLVPVWPNAGLVTTAAALALRLALALAVRRLTGSRPAPLLWLVPRDLLSFGLYVWSFTVRRIDWRGASLKMGERGRVTAEPELTPS